MTELTQPTVLLTTDNAADLDPGGVLSFPYPVGLTAADLLAGQTVYLTAYGREFPDLATAFTETTADVTWAADAPYPLPVGEYNCAFQTSVPQGLPDDAGQVAEQPAVDFGVNPAVAIAEDADLPTAVLAINNLVVTINDLITATANLTLAHNALLSAMQAANVMAGTPPEAPIDASVTSKRKSKK